MENTDGSGNSFFWENNHKKITQKQINEGLFKKEKKTDQ